MKVFVFDAAKCNGCYGCQLACKDEHAGNDWRPIAAPQPDTGHFWCKVVEKTHGQTPKVRVEYTPHFCNHCADAPCMDAAPDAVYRRDDGLIIIDPDKAANNKALVDSCPYGAIYWNEELSLPQKCTGCAHLVDEGMLPHCVDVCTTGALRFGDEEDFADEIAKAEVIGHPELGPHVYYLNRPKLFMSGEVWDPEPNDIIEGAKVTLQTPDGNTLETETDFLGDFWFRQLEPGNYELKIEAAGFAPVSKSIELKESLNVGDFPLAKQ